MTNRRRAEYIHPHMFDGQPTLDSDLDWLLQSGQSDPEALAQALVKEYYSPVYRLCLAVLNAPYAAAEATRNTFAGALANVHRYRGQEPARVWVYRLALHYARRYAGDQRRKQRGERLRSWARGRYQAFSDRVLAPPASRYADWSAEAEAGASPEEGAPLEPEPLSPLARALSEQPEQARLAVLLVFALEASPAEAGSLVGMPEMAVDLAVQLALDATREAWLAQHESADLPADTDSDRLVGMLLAALDELWPAAPLPGDIYTVAAGIHFWAQVKAVRRRRRIVAYEAALTVVGILFIAALIWAGEDYIAEVQVTPAVTAGFGSEGETLASEAGPQIPPGARYTVRPGDSLASIASNWGLSEEALRTLNRIPSGTRLRPGQQILIGAVAPDPPTLQDTTPLTPTLTPEKLTLTSQSQEIRDRLLDRHNRWQSLWFDAQVRLYGPAGYVGPAETHRVQAWLPAGDAGPLVLYGPPSGGPEMVFLLADRLPYLAMPGVDLPVPSLTSTLPVTATAPLTDTLLTTPTPAITETAALVEAVTITSTLPITTTGPVTGTATVTPSQTTEFLPGSGLAPYIPVEEGEPARLLALLREKLSPLSELDVPWDNFPDYHTALFQPIGAETIANHPVLIVDQFDDQSRRVARLWIEPETGAILRKQQFGGFNFHELLWEYEVTGLAFNINMPVELFDPGLPWRGGYALDYTGRPVEAAVSPEISWTQPDGRVIPAHQEAPPGFDPAWTALTFRYLLQNPDEPVALTDLDTGKTYLYADGYYLGRAPLPDDPWLIACDRSPDGYRLAFKERFPGANWQSGRLSWLHLSQPSRVNAATFDVAVTAFAFSPDGLRLAVFGLGQPYGVLNVYDTLSGETTRLLELVDAQSLAWSPDGAYLALIGILPESQAGEQVLVIDLASGETVYQVPYDLGSRVPPADSPITTWGIPFPVEQGGLGACAYPGQ